MCEHNVDKDNKRILTFYCEQCNMPLYAGARIINGEVWSYATCKGCTRSSFMSSDFSDCIVNYHEKWGTKRMYVTREELNLWVSK